MEQTKERRNEVTPTETAGIEVGENEAAVTARPVIRPESPVKPDAGVAAGAVVAEATLMAATAAPTVAASLRTMRVAGKARSGPVSGAHAIVDRVHSPSARSWLKTTSNSMKKI